MSEFQRGDRVKAKTDTVIGTVIDIYEDRKQAVVYFDGASCPSNEWIFALEKAPADDLARLQAENARLQTRINAMTEMHKHTEGVYDMQYRLERENSMKLFHALSKVAPDTLKGLKLNQSNTELDKVYLEYSRRLERLSMALANVRDAETLEECREAARKALEGGE